MANPRAKTNGNGHEAADALSSFLQSPATNGFLVSQKLAAEATRFWARRMRAYADQMETLTKCADAGQMLEAQRSFIERMQEDYAKESSQFSELISQARDQEQQKAREA
ncbi:MAG: phasin family protein [Hyphomonadaceae bacterium]|nr:phasin family protein [Hyphomonadaceae bacterium]